MTDTKIEPRLLSIKELQSYVGMCRRKADLLGQQAGAKHRIGKRVVYDLRLIDRYIDSM